jgi:hypothetical protein
MVVLNLFAEIAPKKKGFGEARTKDLPTVYSTEVLTTLPTDRHA